MKSQCDWLANFRTGIFDVEDLSRCGRLFEADEDNIKTVIYTNCRLTSREISEIKFIKLDHL